MAAVLPLLVFAQRADAAVDVAAWNAHAERFLDARIGLAEHAPDLVGPVAPRTGFARFVVAPHGGTAGMRAASARIATPEDVAKAAASEQRSRAPGAGLARLAARCPTVWVVERDAAAAGQDDALAWQLAVVLAGVLLGPIHDEGADRLVGAKSARAILDALRRDA